MHTYLRVTEGCEIYLLLSKYIEASKRLITFLYMQLHMLFLPHSLHYHEGISNAWCHVSSHLHIVCLHLSPAATGQIEMTGGAKYRTIPGVVP